MKQFFEQYGGVALGILALLVLIAMITPVGNIIKTSLQGTTETFSTKIESQHDDALEATAKLIENSTYLATDGDFNGLHYHNDELFTGTCEENHLTYVNGETQIDYLSGLTVINGNFDTNDSEILYIDSNNIVFKTKIAFSPGKTIGAYYDRYINNNFIDGHIYYFDADYEVSDNIVYTPKLVIENNPSVTNIGNWETSSGIKHISTIAQYNFNAPQGNNAMVFYFIMDNGIPAGTTFSITNMRVIDLTETYGSGNENINISQVKEDLHL